MATEEHITMSIGEDRSLKFSVAGTDPTAATEIQYAVWAGSTALFTTKALTTGVVATDAVTITVTLDAADTAGEEPGVYQHRLRLTNASSKASDITTGTLTLTNSKI